jgi:alanyl-tRNA synthetase
MERQREKGRESWAGSGEQAGEEIWMAVKADQGATAFLGYEAERASGALCAIIANGARADRLEAPMAAELVFDTTPFYAESGGQAGDRGEIRFVNGAVFEVEDVQKRAGAVHGHVGQLIQGAIKVGDAASLEIDAGRRAEIRANHSATHLLHAALRAVLGPHVTQKGSLVEADRLRFDFSHGQPITPDEIEAIEAQVNAVVRQNRDTQTRLMPPADAIEAGALALVGEKYGDEVRVLTMGAGLAEPDRPYSVELCGGTHVARTGDIAVFSVLSEGGVAAGVRRIEAATGAAALAHLKAQAGFAKAIAVNLRSPLSETPERVAQLAQDRRRLEQELAEAKKKLALSGGGGAAVVGPETVAGVGFIGRALEGVAAKDLRGLIDEAKQTVGTGVAAYIAIEEAKASIAVGVTDDLKAKISAVDLVRAGVAALGGQGGGGRPDMAQGGGPLVGEAQAALAALRAALEAALAG